MMRILVAFYSRTGTTRRVARRIASTLDADMLAIRDIRPRNGVAGLIRSLVETVRTSLPQIGAVRLDAADYDLVLLGTPVWAGHVASPMRRFLHDQAGRLPSIAFFCTMAGDTPSHAFDDMRALLGREPLATCAIGPKTLPDAALDTALEAFVDRLDRVLDLPLPTHGLIRESHHVGL